MVTDVAILVLLKQSQVPKSQPLTSSTRTEPTFSLPLVELIAPASTPTPTPSPKAAIKQPKPSPTDNSPWGVAKQIDKVTWTMKIGEDERMGTPQEILQALNTYRQTHGSPPLTWDDRLAGFALNRAKYLESIKSTDQHKGFEEYLKNEDNVKALGFWEIGENCDYGYRLLGVHLIEWLYASDAAHNANQLNTSYSHVGIGVSGLAVSIIFGGWKI